MSSNKDKKSDLNGFIELYNDSEKHEKLIIKDLLNDLLGFDLKIKQPTPKGLNYKYFEKNYKQKMVKAVYHSAIKNLGKKEFEYRFKNFWKVYSEETFGFSDLGEKNTVSKIPTGKIRYFQPELQELVNDKIISKEMIFNNRKLILKFLYDYNILVPALIDPDRPKFTELVKLAEENNHKDHFFKFLHEVIKDNKKVFGDLEHEKGLKVLEGLEEKFDECRFNKEEIQKLLSKTGTNEITFNSTEKKLYYNGEVIHYFKTKSLKFSLLELMYKFEKGIDVPFSDMYSKYENNGDNYYDSIDNKAIIEKIKKLIGKTNELIKEKTKNKSILIFSQRKEDNKHYIIRNY